ncbi:ADP-ribosylglycohydrolase family protein [Kitasatospora phosalacinea]|uniref:Hydrolase n=1 Tax=Kitasatospora phosalacinea TaxID=2065 RepID=A0A9W6UPM9_9ACTN|nr:ADP-ribosylglycohydrolase family protein [Kitasatospora phosalacinea]GLW57671.1 hydrolase [Kitasatospora phosalacinea]
MTATPATARQAARDALEGLALGDAFGERWFKLFRTPAEAFEQIRTRRTPEEAPWYWTDDTATALCVYRALLDYDGIGRDGIGRDGIGRDGIGRTRLAAMFGATFLADPGRGYGRGMKRLLPVLAEHPQRWKDEAVTLFDGQGSLGNGAAMRVAPLGAWFAADLDEAAEQAVHSAEVTHAHPEGIAGAVAVALAAALAARGRTDAGGRPGGRPGNAPAGAELLREVAARTPGGAIREGVTAAADLPAATEPWRAADLLGSGQRVRASDTVPFALWSAAHHLDSLTDALWTTAEGLGDVDTTCAITGGVVAARTGLSGVPAAWRERREELPGWVAHPGVPGE